MPRDDKEQDKVSDFQEAAKKNKHNQSQDNPISHWLRKIFSGDKSDIFPERLIQQLEKIWDTKIAPVLIEKFGFDSTLYAIFYRGITAEEVIMEIWDPNSINKKASEVFEFKGFPEEEIENLPRNREQAKVFILETWS